MKVESDRGAVRLIKAVIKNTYQAIEHPKIVGKKSVRSQEKWYKDLIKWSEDENNVLMSFWGEIAEEDEGRVKKFFVKRAKSKLRKLKSINNPL